MDNEEYYGQLKKAIHDFTKISNQLYSHTVDINNVNNTQRISVLNYISDGLHRGLGLIEQIQENEPITKDNKIIKPEIPVTSETPITKDNKIIKPEIPVTSETPITPTCWADDVVLSTGNAQDTGYWDTPHKQKNVLTKLNANAILNQQLNNTANTHYTLIEKNTKMHFKELHTIIRGNITGFNTPRNIISDDVKNIKFLCIGDEFHSDSIKNKFFAENNDIYTYEEGFGFVLQYQYKNLFQKWAYGYYNHATGACEFI